MNPLLFAPLALTAGVLSFTSPCCLPLLPGYVAYMSSLPDETRAGRSTRVRAALLFTAGFSVVFTALGTAVAVAGGGVASHLPTAVRASGVVLIAGGLATAGLIHLPGRFQRELRPGLRHATRGPGGAFFLGAAFAAGWTPCIGPVLASILAVTASTGTAAWGATLLLVYSVGLGIPFVLLAAGADRPRWLPWLRRHGRVLELTGGLFLTAVGVLLVLGSWDRLLQPLQRQLAGLAWPPV